MPKSIYLDYASSADPGGANPSAIHAFGVREKEKLENARRVVARILNAQKSEIVFTSGSTESNNLALLGMAKGHMITTNIEHASIIETAKARGKVTFVPVQPNGIVDPKKIKNALRRDTILVSVLYANNEIGTIQPIKEIAKEIRHHNKIHKKKVFFHTDATQAINYLDINVGRLGVDLMSFNSAKIYGPEGVGVLYVKKNTPLKKIMFGGDQEMGLRPGTENVSGIIALAQALAKTERIKEQEAKRLTKLRDYFFKSLTARFSLAVINGDLEHRLPNNVSVTFPKIPSDLLVLELSARGIMCSSKSACKSSSADDSHVITALRRDADPEVDALRFSLGRATTKKDIDYTLEALSQILTKLKKWYN